MKRLFIVATCFVFAILAGVALANSPRATRGDAEAVFQASPGGGFAIRDHAAPVAVLEAAPTSAPRIRIAPIAIMANDGKHMCALDWHVIAIAWITSGDKSYTMQDAKAALDPLDSVFFLDGAELSDVRTTAIKRSLNPGVAPDGQPFTFFKQTGKIVAPDELAIGAHTLKLEAYIDGVLQDLPLIGVPITFFIDAEGTGSCL